VRDRPEPIGPIEGRARERRRGADRQLPVVDDLDRPAEAGCRLPALTVGEPLDRFDPVQEEMGAGVAVRVRRQDPDRIAGANRPFNEDPSVDPNVGRADGGRDPSEAAVRERAGDRLARSNRLGHLEDEPLTDGESGPGREKAELEPLRRQVLAAAPRCDRVALGGNPPDRFASEEADRPQRATVLGRLSVAISDEPEPPNPGLGDRSLRDAAGGDVHLEDATAGFGSHGLDYTDPDASLPRAWSPIETTA